VVTHDRASADQYACRIVTIDKGRVIGDITNCTVVQDNPNSQIDLAGSASDDKIDRYSGLGFANTVKFGFRIMWSKKVRLVFSLIIPIIMLTVLGLTISPIGYNQNINPLQELYSVNNKYGIFTNNNIVDSKTINISNIKKSNKNAFAIMNITNGENEIKLVDVSFNNLDNVLGRDIESSSNVIIDDNTTYDDLNISPLYGDLPRAPDQIAIPRANFDYMRQYGYYDYSQEQEVFFDGQGGAEAFWQHLQTVDFAVNAC